MSQQIEVNLINAGNPNPQGTYDMFQVLNWIESFIKTSNLVRRVKALSVTINSNIKSYTSFMSGRSV
jgi:3-deoxy-D-arabino-heptulosonate 7-phosphate (DAHP) synthase class II